MQNLSIFFNNTEEFLANRDIFIYQIENHFDILLISFNIMDQKRFDHSMTTNHNSNQASEEYIQLYHQDLQFKSRTITFKQSDNASLMDQEIDASDPNVDQDAQNSSKNENNYFQRDSDPQLQFEPFDLTHHVQAILYDNEKKDIVPSEPIPIGRDQQQNTNFDGDFQEAQNEENYDPIQDKKGLENVTLSTDATENHQIALEKGKDSVSQNIRKEQGETHQISKQSTRKQSITKNRNQFFIKTVLYKRILTVVVSYYFRDSNPNTKPKTGPKMKDWVFNNFEEIRDIFSQRKFREEVLLKILKLNLSLSGDKHENFILWKDIMNMEEMLKIARECEAKSAEKRRYYVESIPLLRKIWQGELEIESIHRMEKKLRKQKQQKNLKNVSMQQEESVINELFTTVKWSMIETQSVFTGHNSFSLQPGFFTDVQIPQIEAFYVNSLNSDESISLDQGYALTLKNQIIDEKQQSQLKNSFLFQLQQEEEDLMINEMDFLDLGWEQESELKICERRSDLWID